VSSSDHPPAAHVRAELDRILASEIFTRSERLSAYLTFIVERTLAGEGDTLKEQVIAIELYGKGTDFNTAADPIVRVDARRLRDRLREYYASAPTGDVVISVPKGSYTPEFTAATPTTQRADHVLAPAAVPRRALHRWWIAAAVAVAILPAAWFVAGRVVHRGAEPTRLLTVTSLPGAEEDPSISPDGNFVAFSWRGSSGNLNADIWVKAVEGDAMRQLTDTPEANERWTEWSRDGQHIAFTRRAKGTSSVLMVSALGGEEKTIAPLGEFGSWLPDGKSLVMVSRSPEGRFSLVQHVLESGARQQLTEAPVGFTEVHPKVSPDGKAVVFIRHGAGRSAVFLKTLSGGEPVQLVDWSSGQIGGLLWTPDGRDVIYARPEMSGRRLVRFTVGSQQPPTPLVGVPYGALASSASLPRAGGGYRLAMFSGQPDISLRLIDLQAPRQGRTIGAATPFCDATRVDVPGRFSRDGSHVGFVSDRSGAQQVWVARRDQSGLRSVTQLKDATANLGSWSPDGRSIVFDATIAANTDIYITSVDGGSLTRLTDGPAIEMDPEWSRDGRWIYYASDETGRSEIWRMSADGRTRIKLTSGGGFDPRESSDGQFVYFVTAQRRFGLTAGTRLERVATQGGAASLVHSGVVPGAWDLADDRVVFLVPRPGINVSDEPDILATFDIPQQRVHELGSLAFRVAPFFVNRFLAVSPDGRWVLAAHQDSSDRDILVLDNFR
jgi:Tol biopolymer transport system component